jgi:hypothetical protein
MEIFYMLVFPDAIIFAQDALGSTAVACVPTTMDEKIGQ